MMAPPDGGLTNLAPLWQRNVPTVIIDRKLEDSLPEWPVDAVRGDSVSGAKALTSHLIGLGHQKIAMLSGDMRTSTAQDRVQGYRLALEEAGLPVDEDLIFYGEFRVSAGEDLTRELLESQREFTSIFAANNAIGMGVVRALIHRDIRVPEDVALVFYDDTAYSGEYFPFFTVVTQNAYEIGTTAAELLISRVTGQHVEPRQVVLPSQLVVRYSCGSRINPHGVSPLSLPILHPKDLQEDVTQIEALSGNQGTI
jgi:LacI family transcriptional regulator